jgi:ketosteroid isomerase-like protein
MPVADRTDLVREVFSAYRRDDRAAVEALISEDFKFFSPPDPGLDREQYFERCWSTAGRIREFEFKRLVENGDEVIVTYEATRADHSRFRNTEVLTFAEDELFRVEVYFGWEVS